MRKILALAFLAAGFGVGLVVGFVLGFRHTSFHLALEENKVAQSNLMFAGLDGKPDLTPQLREYLKARIYCNVHAYYPSKTGYLLKRDWDFGPVDKTNLGNIGVFKDPHLIVWDWPSAIADK